MGKGRSGSDTVSELFTVEISGALAAGVAVLAVAPVASFCPRASAIADTYAMYQVRKLRFRLLKVTVTGTMAACYIAGITDNGPATVTAASESHAHVFNTVSQVVHSNWVKVPRGDLRGMHPWYKTVPGTPETAEESAGSIYFVGTGTDSYAIEMQVQFAFRDAVSTTDTPVAVELRRLLREEIWRARREKERKELLTQLAPLPPPIPMDAVRALGGTTKR